MIGLWLEVYGDIFIMLSWVVVIVQATLVSQRRFNRQLYELGPWMVSFLTTSGLALLIVGFTIFVNSLNGPGQTRSLWP